MVSRFLFVRSSLKVKVCELAGTSNQSEPSEKLRHAAGTRLSHSHQARRRRGEGATYATLSARIFVVAEEDIPATFVSGERLKSRTFAALPG